MSSPDRFSDNRYKNWLKCGLALIVMKEELHQHVHSQVQNLHNYLISKVSPLSCGVTAPIHCGVCTWQNIKYDRQKKLWHMNCSKNICNLWLREIITVHKTPNNPKINWQNCDVNQWPSDPYQVAKAFMPNGQANVTKLPEDLDPPAVLSLLYYCSFLCQNVPNTQILHDLIEVRNSLFHSGNFFVEDLEKDTWINNMLQLLQDLNLNGTKIDEIKSEDLDINFRKTEIRVFEALVSTLHSDFKTMYAALNVKISSLEDCQKEQEDEMGKVQDCFSESTVKVVTMEAKMESLEKFTQDLISVKTFFDNNSDLINNNTKAVSKLQDHFEILKTKLENTNEELTNIKSRMEGVKDLDRKVSDYRVDLEKIVRKLEMLSGEFVKIQPVIDKWNRNKIVEEKNMKSTDQTLGDQEQRSFQQDGMPAAWTFTKEQIDRAWVPMERVLVEDLAPSYILSSLTFLSDDERQAICQMQSRGEMVKVVLCRVKEQLPDAFCILLSVLKEKGPEQLAEKLVKIIKGTCILNYAPKSNMSSLTMKLNVKGKDGTIVSETEIEIAGSINRVSAVFSEDLQLMVTNVIVVGSVIIHLQPLSEHAQATLAFFCKHGGIKDLVLNLLRKKDIYASLPVGEVWIEVEVCHHEKDVVSEDASEPWRDFASESFEVISTDHVIKENLRLQYGKLLDEIEPLHLKKTFTDKGILDECFLKLRDLERRRERVAYFLDKLLATGSDEALMTLVVALKESGRENLATNLVAKRTPYLNDTDDMDESLIQVVKASQKHAEGSILWSCCLKVNVENNDDGKEQGMRHPTEKAKMISDQQSCPIMAIKRRKIDQSLHHIAQQDRYSQRYAEFQEQMNDNGRMLDEVIKNFKTQKKVKNILLLGLPSAGKSSLINSLVSLILGKYIPVASVGQGDQLAHTYAAHRYEHFGIIEEHLRGSPNEVKARMMHQFLPNVDDFVGLGNENTEEMTEILGLKVFGHLEPGIQITALCDRQKRHGLGCLRSLYTKSKEEWKTDAVVFVHSVATNEIPTKLIECVLQIIKPKDTLRPVDVDYYVVLTNMDKVESGEVSEENLKKVENAIAGIFGFHGFKEYKLVKVANWSDDLEFPNSSVEDLLRSDERRLTLNSQLLKLLRNMSITKAEVKPKDDIGIFQEIWFRLYGFLTTTDRNNHFDPRGKKDIFFAAVLGLLIIIVVCLLMTNKSK